MTIKKVSTSYLIGIAFMVSSICMLMLVVGMGFPGIE